MKSSLLVIAALVLLSNVAHAVQSKARMDEAFRGVCRGTVDGVLVTLELFEMTGDKGEPYGNGRTSQSLTLDNEQRTEIGAEGAAVLEAPMEGKAVFTDNGATRTVEIFVIENPAQKFAQFDILKNGASEVEIKAITMGNRTWGKFLCEAPPKPAPLERDLY